MTVNGYKRRNHLIYFRYYAALVLLCGIPGCGSNIYFGGRVTYSDDGSPLTTGVVCFESTSFLARGENVSLTDNGSRERSAAQ